MDFEKYHPPADQTEEAPELYGGLMRPSFFEDIRDEYEGEDRDVLRNDVNDVYHVLMGGVVKREIEESDRIVAPPLFPFHLAGPTWECVAVVDTNHHSAFTVFKLADKESRERVGLLFQVMYELYQRRDENGESANPDDGRD